MSSQIHVSTADSANVGLHVQPCAPAAPEISSSDYMKPEFFSTAVAEQYAAMITRFWRDLDHSGRLNRLKPVDIVDLCPGSQVSGALLIKAVRRRAGDSFPAGIRYFSFSADRTMQLDENFCFTFSLSSNSGCGKMMFVSSRYGADSSTYTAENPLVVIAHDAWAQMHQELYAVHYGSLLRANIDVLMREPQGGDEKLWESVGEDCWDHLLHRQLAHYRLELNSSPLIYPRGALLALASFRRSAPHGCMVMSFLKGGTSDVFVRLSSFTEVTAAIRNAERLPVNLQLISSWAQAQGDESDELTFSGGRVLQVILTGEAADKNLLRSVMRCVDPSLFESAQHLAEVLQSLGPKASLESRLCLLHMSKFDPLVFLAGAPDTLKSLSLSPDIDRRRWQQAIENVWSNYVLCPGDPTLYQWIAQAAMHCGHWGLARRILRHGLAQRGDNAADLANLAWCEARTGHLGKGAELATAALAIESEHPLAREVNRRLVERLSQRDMMWDVELHDSALPISLEPLDITHAEALSYQYRDAQIAVMTGLPALADVERVREWIRDSAQEPGRVNYAVLHDDWGFVGFINLAVSEHAAFFCFWTGVDFQGQGFATVAGRLACKRAEQCGVPLMLTSAYKDNHRSIRALKRMGFREIEIRARPPDHERIFFSLFDPAIGPVDCVRELVAYYRREKLVMEFELPEDFDLLIDDAAKMSGGSS